ncbi:MAG: hypothetical protein PVJ41_06200 [Desulfobacterales bacterium]|jgi:hypothetical protein
MNLTNVVFGEGSAETISFEDNSFHQAGFKNAELVAKTGFYSSPKTEDVLIRAQKI